MGEYLGFHCSKMKFSGPNRYHMWSAAMVAASFMIWIMLLCLNSRGAT